VCCGECARRAVLVVAPSLYSKNRSLPSNVSNIRATRLQARHTCPAATLVDLQVVRVESQGLGYRSRFVDVTSNIDVTTSRSASTCTFYQGTQGCLYRRDLDVQRGVFSRPIRIGHGSLKLKLLRTSFVSMERVWPRWTAGITLVYPDFQETVPAAFLVVRDDSRHCPLQ
jgi:hypothetical protein